MGAIQKLRALEAVRVTRTRCQPSSTRITGLGNSPLKRRFSLRVPDSKKRSSAVGARKLMTDSMPMTTEPATGDASAGGVASGISCTLRESFSDISQETSQPCGAGPNEKLLVRMKFGDVAAFFVSAEIPPSRTSSASCGEE